MLSLLLLKKWLALDASRYHTKMYGHEKNVIFTPNLDALAGAGCRLENYYVQPVCSPTRSTIMQAIRGVPSTLTCQMTRSPEGDPGAGAACLGGSQDRTLRHSHRHSHGIF